MKRNKTPGCDGISTEFYIVFWDLLGEKLLLALKDSYLEGELPKSLKRGIISI